MTKKSKISDNESAKGMLDTVKLLDGLKFLYKTVPFSKNFFPKLESAFTNFTQVKEQTTMLLLPDKFNELFSNYGWIAYESMNFEVLKTAVDLHERKGLLEAQNYLADSYDESTLEWGILSFNGHPDFRKRIRLTELAKEDYLSGRYHACIPLLLSLLDGIVNDVSKHVGFFASNTDLTAWDCIAAHETGLQTLTALLNKGRNKTNEEIINIPYRNGILHGRDLAFDNKIVAAKCWAALFAIRDWAKAIENGKQEPKTTPSWADLFSQISKTTQMNQALDNWQARTPSEMSHLPFNGDAGDLPPNSPEKTVAVFMSDWCNKRFGPLSETLLNYTNTPKGLKAGRAKEDFGAHIPTSFKILSVHDETPAISNVVVELCFNLGSKTVLKELVVRVIYADIENNTLLRSMPEGHWQIIQHSFSDIIYKDDL